MKNVFLKLLAVVLLTSCSAPKYSYYFDHYDYNAGKRKKEAVEKVEVSQSKIVKEVPANNQAGEQIAIASVKKEASYARMAPAKVTTKSVAPAISKDQRKELVKQVKSAIKKYRNDAKKSAPDDDGVGGGNQLVALLLAIFLGYLGLHRFYLRRTLSAVLQLVLFLIGIFLPPLLYLLFIWVLIDIILIALGTLTPASGSYSNPL